MDGNGRWAIKRHKPRLFGHKAGVKSIKNAIETFLELNIPYLTIFAFSTENWKRPKEEVDGIFNLIDEFSTSELDYFCESGVKFNVIGDMSKLPYKLRNALVGAIDRTKNNHRLVLNVAINYGGRAEIVRAVNRILQEGKKECSEEDIRQNLYTYNIPDPDLIIRTSGENRISNFMLFQCAYSEFYFPKIHWPDFNKKQILKAITAYQKRNRKFGGLK